MYEKDMFQPGEEPESESIESAEGREPSRELDQSTHEPEMTVEESISYQTSEEIEKTLKEIHLEAGPPPETLASRPGIDDEALVPPGEEEDRDLATPINIPGPAKESGDEATPINIPDIAKKGTLMTDEVPGPVEEEDEEGALE